MDAYMEHLVKKNTEPKDLILKFGSIGLIAAATIAVFFFSPAFSIMVGLGLAMLYRYLIFPLTDIEYEYLYCDKTITVSSRLLILIRWRSWHRQIPTGWESLKTGILRKSTTGAWTAPGKNRLMQ